MLNDPFVENLIEQLKRALAVCKKDIRIYYFKAPVLIFGIMVPLFIFLAFYIGRSISAGFLVPGMVGMTIFFTSTSVVPVIAPWESRMRTLERVVSSPISVSAIIFGDVLASFIFGVIISIIPILIGPIVGVNITDPFTLAMGVVLAAFCFSSLGALLSSPPTNTPANVMMLSTLIKFPLVFISGIFIPIEEMPNWGRMVSSASPLTYLTDLLRYCFQGGNQYAPLLDITLLATFAVVFLIAAIKLHERSLPKRL